MSERAPTIEDARADGGATRTDASHLAGDPAGSRAEERAPLSVRVVDRFGRALGGSGLSRRRFLGRAAVVASALTVNPLQYVLRPVPAYASVCGEGASCGSGWTAFCCTVNNGANTCPSGSFVAGWWKIDASPFCRNQPRYIIDCNRSPGSSCNCHCADDPCDTRRVCCNVFRYGQCNTQIGGVTEVVCRVVTCAPPWEWDPACSRTVRTDNRTVTHNSRCLPGRWPSHIEMRYQDLGMVGSYLGAPTTPERDAARGGRYRRYERGSMYWSSSTGARAVRGALDRTYRELGGTAGPLRYPRTDHQDAGQGVVQVRFERGTIYHHGDTGAHGVTGRSDGRYRALDIHRGPLRHPTASTRGSERGWRVSRFQRGWIHEPPSGTAVELHGRIMDRYVALGGVGGSGLGHATSRPGSQAGTVNQRFERGVIVGPSGGPVHAVRDRIARRYLDLDLAAGPWGVPVSDQRPVSGADGEVAEFQNVTVWDSPRTGVYALAGAVLDRYLEEGGPAGALGLPTTDVFTDRLGQRRATFQGGAIIADGDGRTRVVGHRAARSRGDLPSPSASDSRRGRRDANELPNP